MKILNNSIQKFGNLLITRKKIFVFALFFLFNISTNHSLAIEYNINFLDNKSIYSKEECIEIVKNIDKLCLRNKKNNNITNENGNEYKYLLKRHNKNIFILSSPQKTNQKKIIIVATLRDETERIYSALKFLNNNKIKNIPQIYSYFIEGNKYYLIYSYIEGKNFTPDDLNEIIFEKIYQQLFEFEKIFFVHRDLNGTNIIQNEDFNNIYIIDYDSTSFPNLESNRPLLEDLQSLKNYIENISCNNTCFGSPECIENPFLNIYSSFSSFDNDYMKILHDYDKKNPRYKTIIPDFFKQKSSFIEKRAMFWESLIENFQEIDKIKLENFRKAIEIEYAIANVLKKPNKTIIKLEGAKNKLNYLNNEPASYYLKKKLLKLKIKKYIKELKKLPKDKDLETYIYIQEKLYNSMTY